MNRLQVIYNGWGEHWPLGTLAENAGGVILFEYSPEALHQKLELSPLHLGLRAAAYPGERQPFDGLPGLIADALPDGWGMLLMDRALRKMGRDPATLSPLDRLALIGERAMGALSFEPAQGETLTAHDINLLDLAQQIDRLTAGASRAVLSELILLGGSPHGARPKALVDFDPASGQMEAGAETGGYADDPRRSKTEPWLIKFPARGEHPEACAIEEWYARLARACKIEMPPSRYFPLSRTLAAFGVKRFDREGARRVPLHTLAGAVHADYRIPSLDAIDFLRLTQRMSLDVREVQAAFDRCVFNLVFNNRDDHAKNFSYRLDHERRWRLSPAYDLTFNDGPRGHHQLGYAGETRAPALTHLLKVAEGGGVPRMAALASIKRITAVAARCQQYVKELPVRKATQKHIMQTIAANAARLTQRG